MPIDHLIACLGGGLETCGNPPPNVRRRIRKGLSIANAAKNPTILFSSSFTLNKPLLKDACGIPCSEASAMARYAMSLGFRGEIYCEQQSHDTIGSAYFIFSDFVSFLCPNNITIVTCDFHMERVQVIFNQVASLFLFGGQVNFISTPTAHFPARAKKEALSLNDYKEKWGGISDLLEFRKILFTEHQNYNSLFSSSPMHEDVLASY